MGMCRPRIDGNKDVIERKNEEVRGGGAYYQAYLIAGTRTEKRYGEKVYHPRFYKKKKMFQKENNVLLTSPHLSFIQ
jgi:hypothetical protein